MLTPEYLVVNVTPVSPSTGMEVNVVGASNVISNRGPGLCPGPRLREVTVAIPPTPPASWELNTVSATLVVIVPEEFTTISQDSPPSNRPLLNGTCAIAEPGITVIAAPKIAKTALSFPAAGKSVRTNDPKYEQNLLNTMNDLFAHYTLDAPSMRIEPP